MNNIDEEIDKIEALDEFDELEEDFDDLDDFDETESLENKEKHIVNKIEGLINELETERYIRSTDLKENAIEWYNGQDVILVTLSQKKFINKVKKLAKQYPDEVKIEVENPNGTILAHLPLKYLRFSRPRELTEEEKQNARERLSSFRKK